VNRNDNEDLLNIEGLDKADLLIALYENAHVQGVGILQATDEPLTHSKAKELLEGYTYFDYLYGRVMKIDLGESVLNPHLYDRDNGHGACAAVVQTVRDNS